MCANRIATTTLMFLVFGTFNLRAQDTTPRSGAVYFANKTDEPIGVLRRGYLDANGRSRSVEGHWLFKPGEQSQLVPHAAAVSSRTTSAGRQSLRVTDVAHGALTATKSGIKVKLTSSSTLNPNLPPSGNFDLSHWRLTLPTGTAGNPDTISTSRLVSGYTSQYFYTGSDGAMVFWCPVTGVTTSGSSYPRTELRETMSDGSVYNWSPTAGTATLNATLALNRVPSTGKVTVGQILGVGTGGTTSGPLITLVYKYDFTIGTGILEAAVRSTPGGTTTTHYTVATGIPLNTKFSYQIQVRPDMTLSVQINGVTKYSAPIDPSWTSQGMYFKAGDYVQDNVGTSTEGARVSFYSLFVAHK